MTREEARKWLKTFKGHTGMAELSQAFCVAIKALEQEPCEDCISRTKAIKTIQRYGVGALDFEDYTPEQAERFVINQLNELPSVLPQQKVGKWIAVENEEMKTVGYYCSKCDLPMETEQRTKFCPNCGCLMKGEGE